MYGLEKNSFLLDPKTNCDVFLVRTSKADQYVEMVKGKIAIGRYPHFVLYGLLGIGKTHLLRYLQNKLGEAECLYIETPPLHRRSSFVEIYREVMSSYGRERMKELLNLALSKSNLGVHAFAEKPQGSMDVEKVLGRDLARTIQYGIGRWDILWRFIRGEKLSRTEVKDIEAWTSQIEVPDQVRFLQSFFSLHGAIHKKPVMLFVDEFENTRTLVGDSLSEFTEAFRDIVSEGSPIGTVFALTGRTIEEGPQILKNETVKRRISATNFYSFDEYAIDEVKEFVYQVIQYRRIKSFDVKSAISKLTGKGIERVTERSYPFSEEAIELIIQKIKLLKEQAQIDAFRPKEAMELMDNAMSHAILSKSEYLNSNLVKTSI